MAKVEFRVCGLRAAVMYMKCKLKHDLGLVQTPYFSCAEPNWTSLTLKRNWQDIWFRPCVNPELSSTKVRQTLSNLTLLPHQTKTAVPNWFRRRSFAVLNSSVRFGTWVERRLNRALLSPNRPFDREFWKFLAYVVTGFSLFYYIADWLAKGSSLCR